jgi:polyhydroxyalkanoate synthesis regulator phasin
VSWGALFAGLVVALVVELLLSLLGLGIGLGSIKPATEQDSVSGLGIGAAIWLGISTLLALFTGGWVTAKLAGSVRGLNGVLHSIVMWGLVTLVSFYLMTTAVGALISGAAGIVGKGLSAVSSAAAAVAPQAKEAIQEQLAQKGITPDSIMKEAKQILSQTGKPELQPGQAPKGARGAGTGGAQTPQAVEQELRQAIQKIFASGQASVNAADREAVVNVLVNRSNMSRPDAERTVDGWIQQYQQAAQSVQQAKQQALQTTETAIQGLSKASIWIFILMVLEAGAAALGGWLGARREAPARLT